MRFLKLEKNLKALAEINLLAGSKSLETQPPGLGFRTIDGGRSYGVVWCLRAGRF